MLARASKWNIQLVEKLIIREEEEKTKESIYHYAVERCSSEMSRRDAKRKTLLVKVETPI